MRSRDAAATVAGRNSPALVVANGAHKILFATPNARDWLRKFFRGHASDDVLPARICRWLDRPPPGDADGIRAQRSGSYLLVRQYTPQPDDCIALTLELVPGSGTRSRGTLSRRQQDVLRWVASGKSNKAIAAVLKISPKTVGKHIENVFRKLGVSSRIAAANAYTGYSGGRA